MCLEGLGAVFIIFLFFHNLFIFIFPSYYLIFFLKSLGTQVLLFLEFEKITKFTFKSACLLIFTLD